MTDSRTKIVTALCWLWVAAVAVYMGWGAFSYSGLYRWLAELQHERWGVYYPELTAVVPGFLLAGPALSYLGRVSRARQAAADPTPQALAGRTLNVARATALIGIVAALVAAGAYRLSLDVPDGSEPAAAVDLAALGPGQAPRNKVAILGAVDPAVMTGVTETSRSIDRNTLYVAFVPDGTPAGQPVRLFVERSVGSSADAPVSQGFLPEQTGYLVENGLPPIALRDLEARGVRLASPYYLLKPGDDARVTPYYVVAGVAGLGAFACFVTALIGLIQARRLRRTA